VDGGGISEAAVVYGSEIVSTGGQSLGDYIEGGGVADVFGFASGTLLRSGGSETIEGGGVGSALQVDFGGTLIVDHGGVSEAAALSGTEDVSRGGKSLEDSIGIGAVAVVYGSAIGTVVDSRGSLAIEAGGVGSGAHVHPGALLTVDDGGVSVAPVVSGLEIVSSGGELRGGYIERDRFGGDQLHVYGSASGTVVRSGALAVVEVGGVASGLVNDGGGIGVSGSVYGMNVQSGFVSVGGLVEDLRFGGPGIAGFDAVYVSSGGVAISATVSSGGLGLIIDGGALSSAVVSNHGQITITRGGVASDVTVDSGFLGVSGGTLVDAYIRSGGFYGVQLPGDIAIDVRVSSGASGVVDASATNGGGYILNGGSEYIGNLGIISGTVVSSGGVVTLLRQAVAENLVLHPGAEFLVSFTSATAKISGGVLEVMSGAQEVQSITLSGGGAGLGVIATPSSSGFTEITVTRDGPDAVRAARTPNAALFAQAKAALGDAGALPGSSTTHGGGTSSVVAEVLKPR